MRKALYSALVLVAMCSSAHAGDFDGSRLLICAPVEVKDCEAGSHCVAATPADVGTPSFVRIDFDRQLLVGPKSESPIRVYEKTDQQILMMGSEQGFGWTVVLDQQSGEISATIADRNGAFVLFGSCTPI